MINPNFISQADAIRIIGNIMIVRRMLRDKVIRQHKLSGNTIYYERTPIIEMKKLVSISMTKQQIKKRLNCSHVYIENRVKDGSLRELKNPIFGKGRRYLIEDVEKIEESFKLKKDD